MSPFDETGKYKSIKCPKCQSRKKTILIGAPAFSFTNPVGTDRWNSEAGGHGYRFEYNKPKVKREREMAEALSHMGSDPYGAINDEAMGEGVHDAKFRKGLS